MRTFQNTAAQGDVYFRRISDLPDGAIEEKSNSKEIVVCHSETGHSHVMERGPSDQPAVQMYNGDNPLMSWIKVNRPTSLDHKRVHHTHESIMFQPGIYEIRRQQESAPEGWRQVQD